MPLKAVPLRNRPLLYYYNFVICYPLGFARGIMHVTFKLVCMYDLILTTTTCSDLNFVN